VRAGRRVKKAKDPLEKVVFFIDRSLGKRSVAEPLREAGLQVEVHDDHFPQDAPDEVWLTEVGRRRWYVLTRDERIRYRRLEADAVRNARVGMFVVVSKNLTGPHTAQIIVNALGRIQRFISSHRRPFIAKIYRDGHVEKLDLSS
jgi:hypothetical protein